MGQNMTLGVIAFLVIACSVYNTSGEEVIPANRLGKCNLSFNKAMLGRLSEALQNCASYEVGKKMKFTKEDLALKKKTDSAQDCHIECYALYNCVAFVWSSKHRNCHILTKIGSLVKGTTFVSAMKDVCGQNIDLEVKNYFSDPFLRQKAAKESFLQAKRSYNGTVASRINYSKETKCLRPLIEYASISEEELGNAPALKENNEVPFLPLEGETPTAINIDIIANSGPQRIPGINQILYKNWIITGLYAPPGKIISVTSPVILLKNFTIKIGAHKDKNYGKEEMNRDPDITMDFSITKENQAIGSPYGGLIFILFNDNSFDGETFKLNFENVLKAPHFILGRDTNEDWNNHIKTEAIPWTVFEIPKKIGFVVPSRGAYQLDDVTFNLNEWSNYMDKNDEAAGIVNRPAADLVVIDSQIVAGAGHNGYPIMKAGLEGMHRIFSGFPKEKLSINNVNFGVIIGHELGHNMQLSAYLLSHVSVNLIFNYALSETRKYPGKCGTWGRGSRLFSYIKAGKPANLAYESDEATEYEDDDESEGETESDDEANNYDIWSELLKLPFDGLDGSGWENDGSWNDLSHILASYRKLPIRQKNPTGPTWRKTEKMDLWVKTFCEVKKMNMLPYFQFWNFFITESTKSICNGFLDTPTEIMSWISHIENLAKEENTCTGEGWFGASGKCLKITDEKYNYQRAVDYCNGLEDSASLASITGGDDAILVNYAFLKSNFKGVWIQSVDNPSQLFPYAQDYISEPNTPVILGKYKSRCHYKATTKDKETTNCVGPISEKPNKRYFALCEKNI